MMHDMARNFVGICLISVFTFVHCGKSDTIDQVSGNGDGIDHSAVIQNLNEESITRGRQIYMGSCFACHGEDGTASQPSARSFNSDELRFGSDPYSMWKVLTNGAGMMPAQTWLTAEARYDVVHFIREELMKLSNTDNYFDVTDEFLASLPRPVIASDIQLENIRRGALEGLQEYGQQWFRDNLGNYGPAVYSQLQEHSTAGITIKLDSGINIYYNLLRMEIDAIWRGHLDLSQTKFQQYRGEGQPLIDGEPLAGLDTWHWSYSGIWDSSDSRISHRSPLPPELLNYHGHYKYGNAIVLSYSVMGRKVLEYPQVIQHDNNLILSHTLHISPGANQNRLYVADLSKENDQQIISGFFPVASPSDQIIQTESEFTDGNLAVSAILSQDQMVRFTALAINGQQDDYKWIVDEKKRLALEIPASDQSNLIQVFRYSASNISDLRKFARFAEESSVPGAIPPITEFLNGGPVVWSQKITTRSRMDIGRPHYDPIYYGDDDMMTNEKKLLAIPDDYPYVVDELVLPFENPWNSWIRPTGLDFFNDGQIVISTHAGDVWRAISTENEYKEIEWQRIATGLYEPFDVKIIADDIYVICRDRIMRLHDLNGNGQIDFYESFYPDHDISGFFHAYNFGLETDSNGYFYYTKSGQYTSNAEPGNVIRVSPDGTKWESIATGFRTPNGLTITPDDKIYVSDNEGNWMPANKISRIRAGGFYGYVPNMATTQWSPDDIPLDQEAGSIILGPQEVKIPETFDQPVVWMPQEFDNSPGGGVWSDKRWGPLGDRFIHTSFGKGWMYYLLTREVNGVEQGSLISMPFQLDSGIQRARVNPVDGQIYTVGMTGWDDGFATKYGVFNRIRYTGGVGRIVEEVQVRSDGLEITFNFRLDKEWSMNTDNYDIVQYNYMWRQNYGSAKWSVKNLFMIGPDNVTVNNIEVINNGYSVLLEIPGIQPVDQMRVRLDLKTEHGIMFKESIYMTIHNIPEK
jgi:hypothetical protein